jgi:hypothetical protein
MYIVMAGTTHHQRLPATGGHHLEPPGRRASTRTVEIPQMADVVNFDPVV